MILTVTPNPCVDKTVFIDDLEVGTFMRSKEYSCVPGGKGTNCSRAAKALGRDTTAMVVVGKHPGAHVVEMIERDDGVHCVPVWVDSPTRTITTVLEQSVHRQTAFFEPGSTVTKEEAANIRLRFTEVVGDADVVTFNGTVSDPAIASLYRDLIAIAHDASTLSILDSHGPEFIQGLEAKPYMVKPNVAEAEELLGRKLTNAAARAEALDAFHERGIELVVLSLGKDGALVSRGDERFRVVPPKIEEINPVGSGDCLVAGFAIGLEEDLPLKDAARLACAAGTANAMSWDIGHFSLADVADVSAQVEIRKA
jgi:tagatose 6-phosphate kinase